MKPTPSPSRQVSLPSLIGYLCFAVALVACTPVAELPKAPQALTPVPLPGKLTDNTKRKALPAPLNLHGKFEIIGQVDQFATTGPPLRLRVRIVVNVPQSGDVTIVQREVTPNKLTDLLGIPATGETPATRWPISVIQQLHSQTTLSEWLGKARSMGRCQAQSHGQGKVAIEVVTTGENRAIVYRAQSEDEFHRGEGSGYFILGAEDEVTAGSVKLRKWSRFTGEECNLVQIERVEIRVL